jgi:hypothetical protein
MGTPIIDCNVHGYNTDDDEVISYKVKSVPPFKVLKIRQRGTHAVGVRFFLGGDGVMELAKGIMAAAIKIEEEEKRENMEDER